MLTNHPVVATFLGGFMLTSGIGEVLRIGAAAELDFGKLKIQNKINKLYK